MKKAKAHRIIRRWHRYLGVIFGIQFLFWTLGGVYFSWTNIKETRGEDLRREEPSLISDSSKTSLAQVISTVKSSDMVKYIKSVQLVSVLDGLYYQVTFHDGTGVKSKLIDAVNGKLRLPLNEAEAIAVAKSRMKIDAEVTDVHFVTETNSHHEYREKPLPAYAIRFGKPAHTTVYVSAELGTVQSFRNNKWRVFDFLWMLHTMDYQGRDNINNWILRCFSLLGTVTLISGFALFFISRKKKRNTI